MSAPTGVPTPNQWLDNLLRSRGISNARVARIIGRTRTEVQRWVNGREQIPRHHLAEIAAHLGTARDLDHAIRLKECEDFADTLRRRLRDIARLSKCDPDVLESGVFALLVRKSGEEADQNGDAFLSIAMYNMTHANFIYRLWLDAVSSRDFSNLLAPDNVRLHLQYPANHFLDHALHLGSIVGGATAQHGESAVSHLRALATERNIDSQNKLAQHHAIHMLARSGSANDQALVQELLRDARTSTDLLSVRLGYVGLILRSGDEDMAERYTRLLQENDGLALVDVLFEALHYGDIGLSPDQDVPNQSVSFERSLACILRRLEQTTSPISLLELEARRLLGILDQLGPNYFADRPALVVRIIGVLAQLYERRGPYITDVWTRLTRLQPQ